MQKIIIKHLSGTKANQTESFELPIDEVKFGRDSTCQVVFDPEKDDLVSRVHCKITVQPDKTIVMHDLNSRNGTFVNGQRLNAPFELQAGHEVQLGKSGVKFIFDLDPKPATKTTRLSESMAAAFATREQRIGHLSDTSAANILTHLPNTSTKDSTQGFGRQTVERLIGQVTASNRKTMINVGAGILSLAGIVLLTGYMKTNTAPEPPIIPPLPTTVVAPTEVNSSKALTATDIAKKFSNATVVIESSWKLMHMPSGKQINQIWACLPKTKCTPDKMLPWYIYINGVVEPYLTLKQGKPIGSSGSGSGFVVKDNGYILTNRHVAAGWQTSNHNFELPGVLVVCNDSNCSNPKMTKLENNPNSEYVASLMNWVPSKAKMLGQEPLHGKIVEGRNDYLDITFPKTSQRIAGHLAYSSDNADVALIKIDTPQSLQSVELSNSDTVSAGDSITVMGYPAISPDVVAGKSNDALHQIPDPTVTSGNIGRVIKGSTPASDVVGKYFSEIGDAYQLTVNATGSGNSGGPVFNDVGEVIGIFTAKKTDRTGTSISFAVPIKYGQELIANQKIVD